MKTLGNPRDRQQILDRLNSLRPYNRARWGKMSCHQMVCHLSDCFRLTLGEKTAAPVDNFFTRTVLKWVALELPLPWPRGYKTHPEFDQSIGGTPRRHLRGISRNSRRCFGDSWKQDPN